MPDVAGWTSSGLVCREKEGLWEAMRLKEDENVWLGVDERGCGERRVIHIVVSWRSLEHSATIIVCESFLISLLGLVLDKPKPRRHGPLECNGLSLS